MKSKKLRIVQKTKQPNANKSSRRMAASRDAAESVEKYFPTSE